MTLVTEVILEFKTELSQIQSNQPCPFDQDDLNICAENCVVDLLIKRGNSQAVILYGGFGVLRPV